MPGPGCSVSWSASPNRPKSPDPFGRRVARYRMEQAQPNVATMKTATILPAMKSPDDQLDPVARKGSRPEPSSGLWRRLFEPISSGPRQLLLAFSLVRPSVAGSGQHGRDLFYSVPRSQGQRGSHTRPRVAAGYRRILRSVVPRMAHGHDDDPASRVLDDHP